MRNEFPDLNLIASILSYLRAVIADIATAGLTDHHQCFLQCMRCTFSSKDDKNCRTVKACGVRCKPKVSTGIKVDSLS